MANLSNLRSLIFFVDMAISDKYCIFKKIEILRLIEKLLFQKNHSNKINNTYFDIIKRIYFLQNTSKY